MRRTLALLALVSALGPGCKDKDNTKIVVAVWSDLAVPAEIDTIRIDVTGPTGTGLQTFALTAGSEAGKTKLPATLDLVPLGAKDATFTVKATGLHGQTVVVAQTARISFVSGQSLLLKLFLARDCQAVTCPADYTCAAGACNQPIAITNLPPYNPSQLLSPPDAGAVIDSGGSGGALDSNGAVDSGIGEAGSADLRAVDASSVDTATGVASDVPVSTGGTGGAGGSGGTAGPSNLDGARGTGGAGALVDVATGQVTEDASADVNGSGNAPDAAVHSVDDGATNPALDAATDLTAIPIADATTDSAVNDPPDVCVFQSAEDCLNGIDDDSNGLTDCADPACGSAECVPAGNSDFQLGTALDASAACPPLFTGGERAMNAGLTTSGNTCTGCSCSATTSCSISIYGYSSVSDCTNDTAKTGGTLVETLTDATCGLSPLNAAAYRISNFTKTDSPCVSKDATNASPGVGAKPTASWTTTQKFCRANRTGGGCTPGYVCAPKRQTMADHCAAADGTKSCPAGYAATGTSWYEDYNDQRSCSACSCGTQTPGDCTDTLDTNGGRHLYIWPAAWDDCSRASTAAATISTAPGSQTCCGLRCATSVCGSTSGSACGSAGFNYPPVPATCPASSTLSGSITPTHPETVCCKL